MLEIKSEWQRTDDNNSIFIVSMTRNAQYHHCATELDGDNGFKVKKVLKCVIEQLIDNCYPEIKDTLNSLKNDIEEKEREIIIIKKMIKNIEDSRQ